MGTVFFCYLEEFFPSPLSPWLYKALLAAMTTEQLKSTVGQWSQMKRYQWLISHISGQPLFVYNVNVHCIYAHICAYAVMSTRTRTRSIITSFDVITVKCYYRYAWYMVQVGR